MSILIRPKGWAKSRRGWWTDDQGAGGDSQRSKEPRESCHQRRPSPKGREEHWLEEPRSQRMRNTLRFLETHGILLQRHASLIHRLSNRSSMCPTILWSHFSWSAPPCVLSRSSAGRLVSGLTAFAGTGGSLTTSELQPLEKCQNGSFWLLTEESGRVLLVPNVT